MAEVDDIRARMRAAADKMKPGALEPVLIDWRKYLDEKGIERTQANLDTMLVANVALLDTAAGIAQDWLSRGGGRVTARKADQHGIGYVLEAMRLQTVALAVLEPQEDG